MLKWRENVPEKTSRMSKEGHEIWLKKKCLCGLEHMFVLNHRVACNPGLFAQAVEVSRGYFLIYLHRGS